MGACSKKKPAEVPTPSPRPLVHADTGAVAPAPVPQQPTIETTGRGFTVQVSAWRTEAKARREADKLLQRGYQAYVQPAELAPDQYGEKGGMWYRVRVGSYATLAEARNAADQLTSLLESGYWIDRYRKQ